VLHIKTHRSKPLREEFQRIATVMVKGDIVAAPKPLISRHGDHGNATGLQNAKSLFHSFTVIIDVFEDIQSDHCIKAGIHERKLSPAGLYDIRVATLTAEIEGHWFDVNPGGGSDTPKGVKYAPGTAAQIENPRLFLWIDSLL